MTAIVNLAASTVSEHLSELRRAGLIVERKEGRWVEYRIADSPAPAELEALWPALAHDPITHADAARARELRSVPIAERMRALVGAAR
jgi:DNA-binding transcriptional ArsR family regulator